MLKRLLSTGILLVSTLYTLSAFAEFNIAVIDMKNVVENSKQMTSMKDKLQAKFSPKHDELVNEGKALAKKFEDFEKEKPVLSQKKAKEMETSLQKEQQELVAKESKFRQDLYAEQESSMKAIVNSVKQASENIAKKKGFAMVIDSSSTTFVQDKYNITKEVSKLLDKS